MSMEQDLCEKFNGCEMRKSGKQCFSSTGMRCGSFVEHKKKEDIIHKFKQTRLICCPAVQHVEVLAAIQKQGGFIYSITIVPAWAGEAVGHPFRCGSEAAIVYQSEKDVEVEIKC